MEFSGKKVLLNMVYYTLVALLIATAITFMVYLANTDTNALVKVGYYVLTILFIMLMIFDIIATNMRGWKFISGLILYILTVITIIMTFVVYAVYATNSIIPADVVGIFTTLLVMSLAINVITILIYTVGEKIVEYNTTK